MKNFNFNSADAFSYAIFDGLYRNIGTNFKCINIAPIGAFPRYNKSPYFKKNISIENGVKIESIGFSTIYAYMYYSIFRNLYSSLIKHIERKEENIFIVYSINLPVIRAISKYILNYSPISKIILIVPDLIEDCVSNFFLSRLRVKLIGDIQKAYEEASAFVLLTKQMNERIKTTKPFCVIEGIYNQSENRFDKSFENRGKTIFYSGMLYEKFGVKKLIDAFMSLSNDDYRLVLCGTGDLETYIETCVKKDKRINFMGLIERDNVLYLQSSATLLVNPRQPNYDFTKYSFPSKNIEYLASGRPVLLYELPGIPEEYYHYCFHLSKSDLSVESLSNKIDEILRTDETSLNYLGSRAQNWISENKNSKKQVAVILDLLNRI